MGREPYEFLELFEFLKYCKVKGILKSIAIEMAKAGAEAHDG
jgi:hypothetical protein